MKIVAIPESFAEDLRRTRCDGHGHVDLVPTPVTLAHAAPCRVCLQDALPGESVYLCTYSPFERAVPYWSAGPIFVHAHRCTPYAASASAAEVPDALARRLLSLHAHDAAGHMHAADVVAGAELTARAERFFAEDPRITVLHVHHARPGCFACRIER